MSDHTDSLEASLPTDAERIIRQIQLLNCQIEGFQTNLDEATHQLAFAQEILAETREKLKVAQQALERLAEISA